MLVAFSGGVDSTVVLKVALDELGAAQVLAVTARGDVHTDEESAAAREAAARLGARHLVVTTKELAIPGFSANPPDRCYFCRKALHRAAKRYAEEAGLSLVADGLQRLPDFQRSLRPQKTPQRHGGHSPAHALGQGCVAVGRQGLGVIAQVD